MMKLNKKEIGICKGCRHVRFNGADVGCELGLKSGAMLECEGWKKSDD